MKKTIIALLLMASATFAQSAKFRSISTDTAAVKVNSGPTTLSNINVAYNGSVTLWVKMYDSTTKPYAKNAIPVHTLQIPANTISNPYSLMDLKGLKFTNGLWLRCTTSISDTAQKSGQPSTKPVIEIQY